MTAADKLRGLHARFALYPWRPGSTAKQITDALPEIVAVIEAAERLEDDIMDSIASQDLRSWDDPAVAQASDIVDARDSLRDALAALNARLDGAA